MTTVVQRIERAAVYADGTISGKVGRGLYLLLGVFSDDTEEDAELLAEKIAKLRIFSDENGKMNLSEWEKIRYAEEFDLKYGGYY